MSDHPYLAYLNLNDASEELYKNIVAGYYTHAVQISENLTSVNGAVITDIVWRLAQEGNKNLLSWCYKLWNSGHKDIVTRYFPKSYEAIFNEDRVMLIGKKFNLALKLSVNIDKDGDRDAWGDANDKNSNRIVWQLLPVWHNNKVTFKIKNGDTDMFLKMGVWPDNINDRKVFGSVNSEILRNIWYLEPMILDGQHNFYIVNKQFSQGLKLAEVTDGLGDRVLWGHNGDINVDSSRFAWEIKKFGTSKTDEL